MMTEGGPVYPDSSTYVFHLYKTGSRDFRAGLAAALAVLFFAVTGAIFAGGSGAVIIGGLYWKRGTTAAAWTAMIVGMSLAGFGIVIKDETVGGWLAASVDSWWGSVARLGHDLHEDPFITGQVLTFVAIVASVASYILVSLLGPRTDFDLDKLLHRGEYAVETDKVEERSQGFWEKLGFEETGEDESGEVHAVLDL